MKNLITIAASASRQTGVQFRAESYGKFGIRDFLRDVIAMANADVDGARYIVTGMEFDSRSQKRVLGVDQSDFVGKPSYQSLVGEFIEPPIRIRYQPVTIKGKTVGVFEIGDCQDKPYMMRIDQSETLRRGDAYVRVNDSHIKLGRRQLMAHFEQKFRDSVSADLIEVGFQGDIIYKSFRVPTTDLSALPSAIAAAKLKQMADVSRMSSNSGSTTMVARLTHARLFGSDSPYEHRSAEDIEQDLVELEKRYRTDDEHYLFDQNAKQIQLVVFNQGEEAVEDASLTLVLPNHNAFHVAPQLPKLLRNGRYSDRSPAEQTDYPVVTLKDDTVQVTSTMGDIAPGAPVEAFSIPLRVCVGSSLQGRRMGIRYTLHGRNLRAPAKGQLKLTF